MTRGEKKKKKTISSTQLHVATRTFFSARLLSCHPHCQCICILHLPRLLFVWRKSARSSIRSLYSLPRNDYNVLKSSSLYNTIFKHEIIIQFNSFISYSHSYASECSCVRLPACARVCVNEWMCCLRMANANILFAHTHNAKWKNIRQ